MMQISGLEGAARNTAPVKEAMLRKPRRSRRFSMYSLMVMGRESSTGYSKRFLDEIMRKTDGKRLILALSHGALDELSVGARNEDEKLRTASTETKSKADGRRHWACPRPRRRSRQDGFAKVEV